MYYFGVVVCEKHRKVTVKDVFFLGFLDSKLVKELLGTKFEQKSIVKI
jgi:hypothetical protein